MRLLITILLILALAKIYAGTLLKKAHAENAQVQTFVDYEFESDRLQNIVNSLRETLRDLSKTKKAWHESTDQLIGTINKMETATLEDLVKVFNEAKLKDEFGYEEIAYTENKGLSYEHNRLLLLAQAYENIFHKVSKISYGEPLLERPYLMSLTRDGDSMEIYLAYALAGPVNNFSIEYQGDTIKLDSLPVNLGPINGNIKLCIIDKVTGKKKCYRRHFQD